MFFVLLSLFSGSAHAFQMGDVACEPAVVSFTSPSNQQVNVPVNAVPAIGLTWGCDIAPNYTLTLSTSEGEVASINVEANRNGTNLFELPLSNPMSADTEHTLEIVGEDGWGQSTVISFTTGSSEVTGVTESASVQIQQAILYTSDYEFAYAETDLTVSPAADSDNLSIVRVYDVKDMEEPIFQLRTDTHLADQTLYHLDNLYAPFDSEICLTATQRDGLGNISEMSEPHCATYEVREERTCSVTSIAGMGWFMPLLAMAAIRRRSVSTSLERL